MTSNLPALQNAASPAHQKSGSSSILDAMSSYADYYQFAQALAASQAIPAAFRENVGDCLIALDLSARLGISPLSVFQNLYIVSGKPAFSAQFCIALVNNSGKFSRIAFDEGQDGHCSVKTRERGEWNNVDKRYNYRTITKSVENLFCEASFTELRTNKTFKSGRIDLRFADQNGWYDKNDSKWNVMPRQMLRYRAAALLIRAYAPELVLGLHTLDEIEDATEEPPTFARAQTPRLSTIAEAEDAEPVESETEEDDAEAAFSARIAAASTVAELSAIGAEIGADQTVDAPARLRLREAFATRRREILTPEPAAETPAEPEPEQPPKKTVKKKTVTKAAKTPPSAPEDAAAVLTQKLDAARTIDEIGALAAKAWRAEWNKALPENLREHAEPFLRAFARVGIADANAATQTFLDALEAARDTKALDNVCAFGSPLWPLSTLNIDKKTISAAHAKRREELVDLEEEKAAEATRAEIADEVARGDASGLIKKIFDAPNVTALNKLFCAYTDGEFGALNDRHDTAFEMRFADFEEAEDDGAAEEEPKVPATDAQTRNFEELKKRVEAAADMVDVGKIRAMVVDFDEKERLSVRQVEALQKALDEKSKTLLF